MPNPEGHVKGSYTLGLILALLYGWMVAEVLLNTTGACIGFGLLRASRALPAHPIPVRPPPRWPEGHRLA